LQAADAHLMKDPVMAGLIEDLGGPLPLEEERRADVYSSLLRSITGQQLSTKAAAAIYGRLLERFGGRPPTPREILDDDPAELKAAAGLSRAKVASLRSLAEHVLGGELALDSFESLDDAEAIRELVAVKGIGEWTAHMFLMFTLRRQDILATGDVGIRNAIQRAYGLDAPPDAAAMTEIAEPWRPYRTRACRYLWRSLDNEPAA
jgi:DNA-3-methyladenine glycosylase II